MVTLPLYTPGIQQYLKEARAAAMKTSCAKQKRVAPSPKLPRSAASAKAPTRTRALKAATADSLSLVSALSGLYMYVVTRERQEQDGDGAVVVSWHYLDIKAAWARRQ